MTIFVGASVGYNLLDVGFDRSLVKVFGEGTKSSPTEQPTPEMQNVITGGITSKNIIGGELLDFVDTGNSGISGLGNLNTDVRIWAGNSFLNRATAPFRVKHDGSIVLGSLSYSKHTWSFPFESTDGYTVTLGGAGGAAITPRASALQLMQSTILNQITRISIEELYTVIPSSVKNPSLSCSMQFGDSMDVAIIFGHKNFFSTVASDRYFGFYWKNSDTKLYAVYRTAAGEIQTELTSELPSTSVRKCFARVTNGGVNIEFYINEVLILTVTPGWTDWTSDYLFSIAVKANNSSENRSIYFWDVIVQQDF